MLACSALADPVTFAQRRRGTLTRVQPDLVVIKQPAKGTITVTVNDTTIVHRNGREAHQPDLKIGDQLAVNVMPNEDGSLYAVSIDARGPRKRPAKK